MTLRLLAVAITLAVLPASAHAATVELRPDGTLEVRAAPRETNDVDVQADGPDGVRVTGWGRLDPKGGGCVVAREGLRCPHGVARLDIALGDGDDKYRGKHSLPAVVDAGPGDDEYVQDSEAGLVTTRTDFHGGAGNDTASYRFATPGVVVSKDDVANDGRSLDGTTASDADNIHSDVEHLIGSPDRDTLSGSAYAGTWFSAGKGDDVMLGVGGKNYYETGEEADGADVIRGGTGYDTLSYSGRVDPVTVSVGAGSHDDGWRDEGDDVSEVEEVRGGHDDDTISQAPASAAPLKAEGGGGDDRLIGGAGPDVLDGEIGSDTVHGGPGADTIPAADALRDAIDCGGDAGDRVTRDARERSVVGCTTAGTIDLHATKVSMRLTWTQPGGWRKLRRLMISLVQPGWDLGEIRIDPKRRRLASEDVTLRRGGVVTRSGDRVTARFRYTLGAAWNGGHMFYRADAKTE